MRDRHNQRCEEDSRTGKDKAISEALEGGDGMIGRVPSIVWKVLTTAYLVVVTLVLAFGGSV